MEDPIERTSEPQDFQTAARMMVTSPPWQTMGYTLENCLAGFSGPGKEIYVVRSEGEIIAFAIVQTISTFRLYIQTLYVHDNYRGLGLGTMLLQHIENTAPGRAANLFICVSSFNDRAQKLYAEFGFEVVGELHDFVKEGFTEVLMRKRLGALLE